VARAIAIGTIGEPADLVIWRGGQELTLRVTVVEWPGDLVAAGPGGAPPPPPMPANSMLSADMGLHLAPVTDALRKKYGLPATQKGVVVTDVAPLSPAYDRGLAPGDVVERVSTQPVTSLAELRQRVQAERTKGAEYVLLLIRDSDGPRWVAMPLNDVHEAETVSGKGG
jgi:serine protease Do